MRWLLRFIVTEADRRAIESDLDRALRAAPASRRGCRGRALAPAAAPVLSNAHHRRPHPRFPRRNAQRRSPPARDIRSRRAKSRAHARVDRDNRAHRGHRPGGDDRDGRCRPRRSGQPFTVRVVGRFVLDLHGQRTYRFRLSVADYRALEADHPAFSAVAAYQPSTVTVTDNGTPERVAGRVVSGSYFRAPGTVAAPRPRLRCFGRHTQRADRRTDRRLLGAPIRQRSLGPRTGDDHRRRALRRLSACCRSRSGPSSTTSRCLPPRTGRCRNGRDRSS